VNNRTYSGIGSMQSRIEMSPFFGVINSDLVVPSDVNFRVDVNSGNYHDQRWFTVHIDQRMLDLDVNQVRMTVINNGRLGYTDVSVPQGRGIQYKNVQYCGEAGLLIGTGPTRVSNSVYDTASYDQHFRAENGIKYSSYPEIDQHAFIHLNDSAAGNSKLGIGIKETAFEFISNELQGSVFLNYQITNRNSTGIDSLCVAHYNDWEVENLNLNTAQWIDSLNVGYTTGKAFRTRYAATQILSPGEPQFYAVEALPNTTNGNINLFDGFALSEKWKMMSSGIGRPSAGIGNGSNVVQVTGVKLRDLAPGETRKVTFAYLFADSLPQLIERAKANQAWFRKHNISPSPLPRKSTFCENDTVHLVVNFPDGIRRFRLGEDSVITQLLFEGEHFTADIYSDSSLFISGFDSLFAGPPVRWQWEEVSLPASAFTTSPALSGDSIEVDSTVILAAVDTSHTIRNRWFVNNQLQSDTTWFIALSFDSVDQNFVCLEQSTRIGACSTRVCKVIRTYLPSGVHGRNNSPLIHLFPNPVGEKLFYQSPIAFQFEIRDMMGRMLISKFFQEKDGVIDVYKMPVGIYQCVITGKGFRLTQKLIWQ
jgi:hypothetical protein